MSRKTRLLSLSLVCVGGLMVSSASAQILPGNVWPNPGLNTAAPAGVDQVYSYYNTPYYTPSVTGDTNPRPDGWHRGGVDFGTVNPPEMLFYNPAEGSTLNPPPSGNALEINDNDPNAYGEWFSDWNALPAAATGGTLVELQFLWEYTNLNSTQRPAGSDQFRVSANFGDALSNDTLTPDPNNLGHSDFILSAPGTPDETSWTTVDEWLTVPTGAESMRITVDSGGSSQATGQIWVDDISLAVPEPASIAMLSSGLLLLARRRRA